MADLVLKMLREMRAEAKESRRETRANFGKVFHRLAVLETQMGDVRSRLGSLERHMAALLASMPATSERVDKLEARLAALEARVSS